MWICNFFVVSIILRVSHASEDTNELINNNYEDVNEGSPCDVKVSAVLRNEIAKLNDVNKKILENLEVMNHKMDVSEKNIHEKLDDLEKKFNVLGKKYQEFEEKREENLYEKLYKHEKKIIDKLEQYIEDNLNSLEKHIYGKIDALEKITADKTDITVINHKLDAWTKVHPDLEEKPESEPLTNLTLKKVNDIIAQKFNLIEAKMSDLENTTSHFNFDKLDTLINLEGNFNLKLTELKKMIPDMEENIKVKLDALNKSIPENLEERINFKLNTVEKSILNITENIRCKFDNKILNDMITPYIKKIDEESSKDKNSPLNKTGYWDCKKIDVTGYQPNFIGMDSFNNGKYEVKDGVTHFEMDFAIKGGNDGHVLLSPKSNHTKSDDYFVLNIGDTYNSGIRTRIDGIDVKTVGARSFLDHVIKPSILSSTRFTAFYIKINDGTLELSKKGSSSPIFKSTNERLKTVKYISFSGYYSEPIIFLYDCPPRSDLYL